MRRVIRRIAALYSGVPYVPRSETNQIVPSQVLHSSGVRLAPQTPSTESKSLPPKTPVVEPGKYNWCGSDWNLAEPGVYRFIRIPADSFQVLVPGGGN